MLIPHSAWWGECLIKYRHRKPGSTGLESQVWYPVLLEILVDHPKLTPPTGITFTKERIKNAAEIIPQLCGLSQAKIQRQLTFYRGFGTFAFLVEDTILTVMSLSLVIGPAGVQSGIVISF